jgi:hypothetical protein
MRGTRAALAGIVVAVAALVATACYPPSQTPSGQEIPPGGRVVATLPVMHHTLILDASEDVSSILYGTQAIELGGQPPYRYWVYDDDTGTRTDVPVSQGSAVAISPDERRVLLSSSDPALQVGPVAPKCPRVLAWQPTQILYCAELYLYDLDTGQTQQLTGLDGSSDKSHTGVDFSEDGTAVYFSRVSSGQYSIATFHRLDLATGLIEDADPPVRDCCRWDRGTHEVVWDESTGTLTSEDKATAEVTTLFTDTELWFLDKAMRAGRYIILSVWVGQNEVFRMIDTDTGVVRDIASRWISEDMSRFAVLQQNVAPDGIDRLIIAPFQI